MLILQISIFFPNSSLAEVQCTGNQRNTLSNKDGFISSLILDKKGCGSSRSPWIVSVNPGQTIQIDLIDFAVNQQDHGYVSCASVYGFIIERSLGINYTICGGQVREKMLYTSKTNVVEIYLLSSEKRNGKTFLLKYSGKKLFIAQRCELLRYIDIH